MTRTFSSRSISSVIAARTASIIRISGITCHCRARRVFSTVRRFSRVRLEGKGGRLEKPPGGTRDFVLGGRQERDGGASTRAALLSAERAARHLLRIAWKAARQPARPLRVFLAAPQRRGEEGRPPGPRGRADGREVPGSQVAQAHV